MVGFSEVALARLVRGRVVLDYPDRAVVVGVLRDGSRAVVKVDSSAPRHRREVSAMAAAAAAGVPVPDVLAAEEGDPSLMVMRYVDGAPLSAVDFDGTPVSEVDDGAAWADAGRVLARLHRAAPPNGDRLELWSDFGRWAGALRDQLAGRAVVDATLPQRAFELVMSAHADAAPSTTGFIHSDCQANHFLIRHGAVAALIDFGDAGIGDLLWDIAVLTLFDRERLPVVLAGYGAGSEMVRRAETIIPAYRILRWMGAITWLVDHGFDPGLHIAALDAAVKSSRSSS